MKEQQEFDALIEQLCERMQGEIADLPKTLDGMVSVEAADEIVARYYKEVERALHDLAERVEKRYPGKKMDIEPMVAMLHKRLSDLLRPQ